jgi:hypothetical protein
MSPDMTIVIDRTSPFSLAESPTTTLLETEGRVRYLIMSGRQDDGLWGPIGALWLSEDERRGGFLLNPWAIWEGSELVRGYRSALERGWNPSSIYGYWQHEVWPRGYTVDAERQAESLFLLNELVAAL